MKAVVSSIIGFLLGLLAVLLTESRLLENYRLISALGDENPAYRAAALRMLSLDGNEHRLILMIEDENADVRWIVAQRLGGDGPYNHTRTGAERARALIRLLKDEQLFVRREAAWSLGGIGADAVPVVQEALSDEDPRVRAGAVRAVEDGEHLKLGFGEADAWKSLRADLSKLLTDPDVARELKLMSNQ
jgi:HEAT repeat protein